MKKYLALILTLCMVFAAPLPKPPAGLPTAP